MKLREENSKLIQKKKALETSNQTKQDKITALEKKAIDDCNLLLKHVKEHEALQSEYKEMKKRFSNYQTRLKKANELFKTTLSVKLEYEQVLMKLM